MLVRELVRAVRDAGYLADTISIPYVWDPPEEIFESAETWRRVRPDASPAGKVDLVLATKFPSYAIDHPNKVAWVVHQHRAAYELAGTIYDDMERYERADEYRERIRRLDREVLSDCAGVFAISRLVASRLMNNCGIESEPVYHPPPFDGRYRCDDYSNDIIIVGRLEPLKRVDLAINAMSRVRNPRAVLRVVGSGFLEQPLRELAEKAGVSNRIRFEGFVSDEDLLSLYASCGCALYVPFEEDLGYAVLEAFKSRKPVIVTDDSGGPLEFVCDGINGRIVPARPDDVAAAIDETLSDKARARRLGDAGFEAVSGITWSETICKLVEPFV